MRSTIQPRYLDAQVQCACGNTFATRSTKAELRTEVCSACHPFFSGETRNLDTSGRIERFTKRWAARPAALA